MVGRPEKRGSHSPAPLRVLPLPVMQVNPLRWKGETWFYVAVAILATAPAWIVKYPPIEDLPFHIAATRVIHDYSNPAYGFEEHFKLTFGRTQYVVYYLIASALAYVLGVVKANIALMCVYLGGTVLALRELLRALGKDQRLCLLVVPLLYNAMFVFGLLPFLLGIPTMFFALATVTRSLMWTYVGVIALLILWTVAGIALEKPEFEKTAALWEPFGTGAFGLATKYWTVADRNTLTPAFTGLLLFNRTH